MKQHQGLAFSPDLVVEFGAVYPDPTSILDYDIPPRLACERLAESSFIRGPGNDFVNGLRSSRKFVLRVEL